MASEPFGPYFGSVAPGGDITEGAARITNKQPNLFNPSHPPSAFALTLFSLFGEGHTERADLRPLGPETPGDTSPDGVKWWSRPLGEEVVVDGFDVQLPEEWKGTYQNREFDLLAGRLRQLNEEAWVDSGARKGSAGDLGSDGKGIVLQGWI